jgi:cellulose synthase/poly-beta-1,6-N-acetylglucosamine synthase-like glycosyltransferase
VIGLRQEPRNGKTSALNLAVRHATGDVLVFADANSLHEPGALRHLVSNLSDPAVGYVTGRLVYQNPEGAITADGCGLYMRYENAIRTAESAVGSLVGVNGGIDAVRGDLYEPMGDDDLPDLVLPLSVVARGYRVVYEPLALASEVAHADSRDEYRMRVRVSLRALWTLADMRSLLNVRRYGFFALQLFSHKALRYAAPVFLLTVLLTSGVLSMAGRLYEFAFVMQLAFLAAAGIGYLAERRGRTARLLSVPFYFVLVNAAATQAFVKFLKGERHRVWQPRLG